MKKIYLKWIPVVLPSIATKVEEGDPKYPRELAWWRKESKFYYPNMLISMGIINAEKFKRPKDTFIMGDSGGFQRANGAMGHTNAMEILRTQEEFCDVGFIYDMPTWRKKNADKAWFERCLAITKKDADTMAENRDENSKMKLYGVLQGGNNEEWDQWYDALTADHDFDGWGVGFATAGEGEQFVRPLRWLEERGLKKNIHFFGLLSRLTWGILSYGLASYGFEGCTVDSSIRPAYVKVPDGDTILSRRLQRGEPEFNEPFCCCQVCESYEEITPAPPGLEENFRTNYLIAHNVQVWLTQMQWMNAICDNYDDMTGFVPGIGKFLDMIDAEEVKEPVQGVLF